MIRFILCLALLYKIPVTQADSRVCSGDKCSDVISMPLLRNDLKATLTADLDVSLMNKYLTDYIKQEIKLGVELAMKELLEQMVDNKTEKAIANMDAMVRKITADSKAEIDAVVNKTAQTNVAMNNIIEKSKQAFANMDIMVRNKTERAIANMDNMIKNTTLESKLEIDAMIEKSQQAIDNMYVMVRNKTERAISNMDEMVNKTTAESKVEVKALVEKSKQAIANMEAKLKDTKIETETYITGKITEFGSIFERKDRTKYAFFAYLSSSKEHLPADSVVVFDVVPLNIGISYSGTTGKFTCKEDGIYTFSWTTLSPERNDFTSSLVIDGTVVASNVVDSDSVSDSMTGSLTVVVDLKKGQSVWIKVSFSEGTYLSADWNGPCSVLSGFKIH